MKSVSLALFAVVAASAMPALAADDTMYLDTALKDGWQTKGQSSVAFHRDVDAVDTQFSRLEVIVQKGKEFALCAIETNIGKNTASERPCSTFK
jgi:hypothetical protein